MLQINHNIKKYRQLNNLSQDKIAAMLNVKRTTYANWETSTEPELTKIMELAKIFGIHYTQLIEGDTPQQHTIKPAPTTDENNPPSSEGKESKKKTWEQVYNDLREVTLSNNHVFTEAFKSVSEILKEIKGVRMSLNDARREQLGYQIGVQEGQNVMMDALDQMRGAKPGELVQIADNRRREHLAEILKKDKSIAVDNGHK